MGARERFQRTTTPPTAPPSLTLSSPPRALRRPSAAMTALPVAGHARQATRRCRQAFWRCLLAAAPWRTQGPAPFWRQPCSPAATSGSLPCLQALRHHISCTSREPGHRCAGGGAGARCRSHHRRAGRGQQQQLRSTGGPVPPAAPLGAAHWQPGAVAAGGAGGPASGGGRPRWRRRPRGSRCRLAAAAWPAGEPAGLLQRALEAAGPGFAGLGLSKAGPTLGARLPAHRCSCRIRLAVLVLHF